MIPKCIKVWETGLDKQWPSKNEGRIFFIGDVEEAEGKGSEYVCGQAERLVRVQGLRFIRKLGGGGTLAMRLLSVDILIFNHDPGDKGRSHKLSDSSYQQPKIYWVSND